MSGSSGQTAPGPTAPDPARPGGEHWSQRPEGGGAFAVWLIRTFARYAGRTLTRPFLYPIALYFLLVRGPERRASRDYLRRALGREPRWRERFRHVHTFASTILDRLFLLGGDMDRFDVKVSGVEALEARIDRGQGVLVFGSHLGSFEVLRVFARQRPDVPLRVVFDASHNPALTRMLDALDPQMARGVIDAGQDGPSIALAIKQATDEGALVALLVDRARVGEKSVPALFMGENAPFPASPWLIAAALKVPVVLAFGLYRGGARYDLAFEVFSDRVAVERHNRAGALAELTQQYADRLQHHARSAPYNWFNFYDFWHAHEASSDPRRNPGAAVAER